MKRATPQNDAPAGNGRLRPAVFTGRRRLRGGFLSALVLLASGMGCAAFRPVRGVPASYMPVEYKAATREHERTINLGMLVRPKPGDHQHRVEAGDILTIFVPGVLGGWSPNPENTIGEVPPINMPHSPEDPPTLGYPVQVRDDHTLALPQLQPLNVRGMTLHEVEECLRRAYTVDHRILKTDPARIMVSLLRPREYRVLVVRQEAQSSLSTTQGGMINIGSDRRGVAKEVRLRAYENDVMHALSRADNASGLPGLNAENTLYIIRNRRGRAGSCPPGSWDPAAPAGFMQIPAGDLGGHSLVHASHETSDPRQHIQLTGHQPSVTPPLGSPLPQRYSLSMPPSGPPPGMPMQGMPSQRQGMPMQGTMQPGFSPPQNFPTGFGHQPLPSQSFAPSAAPPLPPSGAVGPGTPFEPYPVETVGPSMAIPHGHAPPQAGYGFPPAGPGPGALRIESGAIGPSSPLLPSLPPSGQGTPIDAWGPDLGNLDLTIDNPDIVKIPVRIAPGENPNLTEEDITLYDGDIVFIESRETEVFYTGGLLGGGQYTLPRDYDLRVLEAIAVAQGSRNNSQGSASMASSGGPSALNQDVIVSASRLIILRKLPDGNQVPIEVDLYRAMKYPNENVIVQSGDYLLLQYKCGEACLAFVQRNLLEGALIGIAASTFTTGGGNR